ncbi:MAG: hypothetical protein ABSA53_35080 [Streptosporangiaceae bacterium]
MSADAPPALGPSRPCVTVPLVGQITIRGISVDLPASDTGRGS